MLLIGAGICLADIVAFNVLRVPNPIHRRIAFAFFAPRGSDDPSAESMGTKTL